MRTTGRTDWTLDLLEDIALRNELLDVLADIAAGDAETGRDR